MTLKSDLTITSVAQVIDLIESDNMTISRFNSIKVDKSHLFTSHIINKGVLEEIKTDDSLWNIELFDRYKRIATRNPSLERIENLIEIKAKIESESRESISVEKSVHCIDKYNENVGAVSSVDPEAYESTDVSINDNLIKNVKHGDLVSIRSAMSAMLTNNHNTWHEIDTSVNWASKENIYIYEDHIVANYAKAIDNESVNWTEDYYYMQEVYLNSNFSLARWEHVVEVRKHLERLSKDGFFRNSTPLNKIIDTNIQANHSHLDEERNPSTIKKIALFGLAVGATAIYAAADKLID